jgi:hypothetical protein
MMTATHSRGGLKATPDDTAKFGQMRLQNETLIVCIGSRLRIQLEVTEAVCNSVWLLHTILTFLHEKLTKIDLHFAELCGIMGKYRESAGRDKVTVRFRVAIRAISKPPSAAAVKSLPLWYNRSSRSTRSILRISTPI